MTNTKRAALAAIFSAFLLIAAATGNIRLTQIRSADLQGNGTKIATTSVSSPTANSPVIFDSGGKLATGTKSGNTTVFATTSGSSSSGNCAKWDSSGNIVDNGSVCGGSGTGGSYGPTLTPPPAASNWTAVNLGSCSALADSNSALFASCPADGGGTCCNKHLWVKSAPATPWTLTAKWRSVGYNTTYSRTGIVLRESSTGKLWDVGFTWSETMVGSFWPSATGTVGAGSCTDYPMPWQHTDIWWKVYHDGTNVTISWSPDGYNFVEFCQKSKTAYASTDWDQIGFGVESRNSVVGSGIILLSWSVS